MYFLPQGISRNVSRKIEKKTEKNDVFEKHMPYKVENQKIIIKGR